MTRARLLAAAALALAAAACGSSKSSSPGALLQQPSAIAVFRGLVFDPQDPGAATQLQPYVAIANAARNDLTLVRAIDDRVVLAPIQLRPLAVPVPRRPELLVAASLGDGADKSDLLVAVTAGSSELQSSQGKSSELQLVRTWAPANAVVDSETVLLDDDVVALAALESPSVGSARIVAALSGGRLAVITYSRAPDGVAIVKGAAETHDLGFQAVGLATIPGDAAHVYAATLDPVEGFFGAAEIDVSAPLVGTLWDVRPLGARAPTRLVAAARIAERTADRVLANGDDAFAGQLATTRVYAALDESGCGPARPIDCGIVELDPALDTVARGHSIPDDDWSPDASSPARMPYRAPIRLAAGSARAEALVVALPPAVKPPDADEGKYNGAFMRLAISAAVVRTTAVLAVAASDGNLHYVDLGRLRVATATSPPQFALPSGQPPPFVVVGDAAAPTRRYRLGFRDAALDPGQEGFATAEFADAETDYATFVRVTPGYVPDDLWTVTYQGVLPDLRLRSAQIGRLPTDDLWLAIQVGDAGARTEVAKLYHPALGVKADPAAGDLAVVRTPAGLAGCSVAEIDLTVAELLAPTADFPGGAVRLALPAGASTETQACLASLKGLVPAPTSTPARVVATIRASGLVLTGALLGYAGRPALDAIYELAYRTGAPAQQGDPAPGPGEDELAVACPLADWEGSFPIPAANECAACDRAGCEQLVLARKVRRLYHLTEDCPAAGTTDGDTCRTRWANKGPAGELLMHGPALRFRVAVEATAGPADPTRDLTLTFQTGSGRLPLATDPGGASTHATGALAFDRSPFEAGSGYRFFVSYPGNTVMDTSPSTTPATVNFIR